MVNQRWAKDTFRTSQGMFHFLMDLIGTASFIITGVVTSGTLLVGLALLPSMLVGYGLAMLVLPRIPHELFQRIAIITVLVAAVLAIASELAHL